MGRFLPLLFLLMPVLFGGSPLLGSIQDPGGLPPDLDAGTPPATGLNILWLSVEDMSPWIGPYGDRTVPTPHLDALAAQSIRYDNAFADSPVCAPARTALITGMYPTRIGAMHMRTRSQSKSAAPGSYGDLPLYEAVPPPFVRCFPEHLRSQAGYRTTNRSKTDYQFKAPLGVWDDSSRRADYRVHADGQPFFGVINHGGTHESQAFPESKRRDKAVSPDEVPIPPIYPDTPAVRDAMARTYNNIAAMDRWVGERLRELEESGEAERTVVFFFSDHGVGLPRGKRSVYGTGTRIPLLIRLPPGHSPDGLPPGSSTDRIVSFIDFGPTVLSLAGVEPDDRLDGRAFLGPFAGAPRQFAFFHADRFDSAKDRTRAATDGRRLVVRNFLPEVPHLIANGYRERIPMTADLYALRDGGSRAHLRTPAQWQTGSTRRPTVEWYDNSDDPWEVQNLASARLEPLETDKFQELERELDQWMQATGDLGLIAPEVDMVHQRLWGGDSQPSTQPPTLQVETEGSVLLRSQTRGATFSYRWTKDGPWLSAPRGRIQPSEQAQQVFVVAHRLGYKPSTPTELKLR